MTPRDSGDVQSAIGHGRLTLRGSLGSPFTRKVRFAAEVLNLASRIDLVRAKPSDENDPLRQQNPLGKMPTLLLPDGSALYDSPVIIEFLQDLAGSEQLIPKHGMARFRVLTRMALADGIMEAGLLVAYETRWRTPELHVAKWVQYQQGKMMRGLGAFEKELPPLSPTDAVAIGLSSTLAYIDWRKQVEWRSDFPALVNWLERLSKIEPAYGATALPPGYGEH